MITPQVTKLLLFAHYLFYAIVNNNVGDLGLSRFILISRCNTWACIGYTQPVYQIA